MSDNSEILKAMQANADALTRLADSQKETKTRLLEIEQKMVRNPRSEGFGDGGGIAELADLIIKSSGAVAFEQKNTPSFSVNVPARLLTKNTIINATGSGQPLVAGDRVEQRGIVFAPQQRLTVRGLFAQIPTSSNLIERPAELIFTNNAGAQGGPTSPQGTGESELKAESAMTLQLLQTAIVIIAHFIKASRQILSDAPLLQRHLDQRLTYGLNVKEENNLLTGDGGAGVMFGIVSQATPFNGGATNQTILDTLAKAANQLAVGNYEPSGFILNPVDWLTCQLLKDTTGRYLLGDPAATTTPKLWGLPVVPTPSMTSGQFICIDAQRYGYIADREDATVRISENVNDDFVRNVITVLAEKRCALVTELGAAAVYGALSYAG
jgi:HK97 family phage major capsid protein